MSRDILKKLTYNVLKDIGKLTTTDIENIEKTIYKSCSTISNSDDMVDKYKQILYECVGDILNDKNSSYIIDRINKGQTEWKHKSYNEMKMRQEEQDDFIQNPFEVEEGVLECKCGSRRVYSYQKQTRGSDEPSTTFAECVACGKKWQYSG
jgi:DNA-directed RNA polymerase subunit M/transcription elongation factor TFIIS